MSTKPASALTPDQLVRVHVVTIQHALQRGLADAVLSDLDRIMVAFAACDRHTWLADAAETTADLWQRLKPLQRIAIAQHLNGAPGEF